MTAAMHALKSQTGAWPLHTMILAVCVWVVHFTPCTSNHVFPFHMSIQRETQETKMDNLSTRPNKNDACLISHDALADCHISPEILIPNTEPQIQRFLRKHIKSFMCTDKQRERGCLILPFPPPGSKQWTGKWIGLKV